MPVTPYNLPAPSSATRGQSASRPFAKESEELVLEILKLTELYDYRILPPGSAPRIIFSRKDNGQQIQENSQTLARKILEKKSYSAITLARAIFTLEEMAAAYLSAPQKPPEPEPFP